MVRCAPGGEAVAEGAHRGGQADRVRADAAWAPAAPARYHQQEPAAGESHGKGGHQHPGAGTLVAEKVMTFWRRDAEPCGHVSSYSGHAHQSLARAAINIGRYSIVGRSGMRGVAQPGSTSGGGMQSAVDKVVPENEGI